MIVLQNNRSGKSFLEVGDVQLPDNYETQMLKANSFKYIAESYFREVDNERVMAFRIDGLTLLTDFYSRLRPTKKELERLLKDLSRVIRELKEYMLSPEGLVLDIRYILYSEKECHHVFLYVPGRREVFSAQLKSLMDEMLKIYNHQDRKDVEYIYEMYSSFIVDNFTPEYFCRLMEGENKTGHQSRREISPVREEYQEPRVEQGTISNQKAGTVLRQKSDAILNHEPGTLLYQETEKKEGPDFSLYVLVMIASVVISLVLFLLFGISSIKVSLLINLAGIAFIAICEMHRRNEDEEDEADRAMSVYMKEPVLREPVLREPVLKEQVLREPVLKEQVLKESVPEKRVIVEAINPVGEVSHPEDEYIETSVLAETAEGVSKLISKGEKLAEDISIPEGRLRIGRLGSVCEYCIDEPEISRVHAVLEKRGSTVTLTDMDSTNGTFVNDRRINSTESVELSQGDIISMADIKYECL